MRYFVNEGGDASSPLVSQIEGDQQHWALTDADGNVIGLTDKDGNLTDTFKYDAFGNDMGRTGTTATPLRYGGTIGDYAESSVGAIQVGSLWLGATGSRPLNPPRYGPAPAVAITVLVPPPPPWPGHFPVDAMRDYWDSLVKQLTPGNLECCTAQLAKDLKRAADDLSKCLKNVGDCLKACEIECWAQYGNTPSEGLFPVCVDFLYGARCYPWPTGCSFINEAQVGRARLRWFLCAGSSVGGPDIQVPLLPLP